MVVELIATTSTSCGGAVGTAHTKRTYMPHLVTPDLTEGRAGGGGGGWGVWGLIPKKTELQPEGAEINSFHRRVLRLLKKYFNISCWKGIQILISKKKVPCSQELNAKELSFLLW